MEKEVCGNIIVDEQKTSGIRGVCRRRVQLICEKQSKTKQEFKKDADINHIMKKFGPLGQFPQRDDAIYGDFSEAGTYQEALERVKKAELQFSGLPAEVRKRFKNDIPGFLEFCADPANKDEMIKLGLADAPVDDSPIKVEVIPQDEPKDA
jgi:phage internal scaffolding protein